MLFAHPLIENACGIVADCLTAKFDARERRGGGLAEHVVVFSANDCDFLRHRDSRTTGSIKEPEAKLIIHCENADWLG